MDTRTTFAIMKAIAQAGKDLIKRILKIKNGDKMGYEILEAKDDLGNDIKNKWQIVNLDTGVAYEEKIYNEPEDTYRDLAYLLVAEDLPLPKTSNAETVRFVLLRKIIEEFNNLTADEYINVLKGNRGDFSFHGRGESAFKILTENCRHETGGIVNRICLLTDAKCKTYDCPNFEEELLNPTQTY